MTAVRQRALFVEGQLAGDVVLVHEDARRDGDLVAVLQRGEQVGRLRLGRRRRVADGEGAVGGEQDGDRLAGLVEGVRRVRVRGCDVQSVPIATRADYENLILEVK
jgi:hypothetical protein